MTRKSARFGQNGQSAASFDRRRLLAGLAVGLAAGSFGPAGAEDFESFLRALWPAAQAAGVSRETFDAVTVGLAPEPAVLQKPKAQAEFTVSIPAYVAGAVTTERVARGRAVAAQYAQALGQIERNSGVPGEIAVAILGVESNFGTATGGADALRVLATLAWRGHMRDKLSEEFVIALGLMQEGVPRARLRGSWAGAMGMPQFLPSAYRKYAVSASGAGAPDIWTSVPDSLASIGNFLAKSGWNPAVPWSVEVLVPNDFDYRGFDMDFNEFRALGFTRADGGALPDSGAASLYLPTGAGGPAFLIDDNFEAIRQYNTSDAYALAVGLLAERIAGRAAPLAPWPKTLALSTAEVTAMQRRLTELGHYRGPLDGKLGRASRNAVHAFQRDAGMQPADGFATKAVLARLGVK